LNGQPGCQLANPVFVPGGSVLEWDLLKARGGAAYLAVGGLCSFVHLVSMREGLAVSQFLPTN